MAKGTLRRSEAYAITRPRRAHGGQQSISGTRGQLKPRTSSTAGKVRLLVEKLSGGECHCRRGTRRGYEVFLRNYIFPKWQDAEITELQARPVELWLGSLDLVPKSKAHIRGLLRVLWDLHHHEHLR